MNKEPIVNNGTKQQQQENNKNLNSNRFNDYIGNCNGFIGNNNGLCGSMYWVRLLGCYMSNLKQLSPRSKAKLYTWKCCIGKQLKVYNGTVMEAIQI